MKKYLKSKIRHECPIHVLKNTIEALKKRGLINEDTSVTKIGYIKGLELLNLKEQCDFLNIPIEKISFPIENRPEIAALKFYNDKGDIGCYTEGGIIDVILNSLCLDLFIKLGQTKGIPFSHCTDIHYVKSYFYSGIAAYGYFTESIPNIEDLMIDCIFNTPKWRMLENFETLKSWQKNDTWFPHYFIGLDSKIVELTYSSLGVNSFVEVAKLKFKDFYAFAKGWPDLLIHHNGITRLIEIKVDDKLNINQIITLIAIRQIAGLNISILKIIPKSSPIN